MKHEELMQYITALSHCKSPAVSSLCKLIVAKATTIEAEMKRNHGHCMNFVLQGRIDDAIQYGDGIVKKVLQDGKEGKFLSGTMDCTPSWVGMLPTFITIIREQSIRSEAYIGIAKEVRKMAEIADDYVELVKPVEHNADFKKYYDIDQKRNIWVLGYFGGGAINCVDAFKVAVEYAKSTGAKIEGVVIDEILSSRRFKNFKIVYSTEPQQPEKDTDQMVNVYQWLRD